MVASAPTMRGDKAPAESVSHLGDAPAGYVKMKDTGLIVPAEVIREKKRAHGQSTRGHGRPVGNLNYEGSQLHEHTRDWLHPDMHPVDLTTRYLSVLRQRSRDLARRAPWFISLLNTICDDVVGAFGFRLQPQIWEDEEETRPFTKLIKQVQRKFRRWANHADIDQRESLWMMLWTAVRELVEAGEFFIHRLPDHSRHGTPLSIQIIPGEMIDHTFNRPANPNAERVEDRFRVSNGIEFDTMGRRVAYHVADTDADGKPALGFGGTKTRRISAKRMDHVFCRLRAGQERGIPWIFGATVMCHNIDDLFESELISAEVASQFAAFVASEYASKLPELTQDENGERMKHTRAGMVAYLKGNEKVEVVESNRPNPNMEKFATFLLRAIGMTMSVSYERMTGDFSKVNFASARMGAIRDDQATDRVQSWIMTLCILPIYADWFRLAVLSNELAVDAIEYASDPGRFVDAHFIPPGRPHHDELKGATSAALRVLAGLSTQEEECALLGRDWEEVDAQRKRELDNKLELGIPIVSIGGAQQITGQGSEGNGGFETQGGDETEPGSEEGDARTRRIAAQTLGIDMNLITQLMQGDEHDAPNTAH